MAQNKCNICNQTFNSEPELRDHQRIAHGTGKKDRQRPKEEQDRREDKIAS